MQWTSPRTWGRSIPAWAGETPGAAAGMDAPEVYPRVGGGNRHEWLLWNPGQGLSPRGRGKPPGLYQRR